ncbi:CobW family GTP-binding protein [Fictibacillus aquaticus]|uniref:CobW C-terminal domain-containing protein n=1 Tax=Fictibacillus aquaticus TaxID=2021314 RepID=A0A235FDY0_9BACL|nr:GTP-binding protein [Fictibacillus aquaticus]OYD59422.1 hypothetical protein CGZ90_05910 [Fictibacillus aquaticus]
MLNEKLPVYVLTGFLGSGKTTALLHILKNCKKRGLRPGILLNELGSVNVETHLFENEKLVEVLDGCVCCTVKEDFKKELGYFLKSENKVDLLFIEGTGVADPGEIVDAVASPELFDYFEVCSVISVVDASRYLEYNSMFSSSKEIRKMLSGQIENSTLILLNKTDGISAPKKEKILKKLKKQTEGRIEMIDTQFGAADIDLLLKQRMEFVQTKQYTSEHHTVNHTFQAVKITDPELLNGKELERKLSQVSDSLIRAKGIITIDNERYHFQYASGSLSLQPYQNNVSDCIILIGYKLPVDQIKALFNRSN